jgi:hypothetical protein
MIRVLMLILSAAALITLMSVSDVSAQGRGRGHGNWKSDNDRRSGDWNWDRGRRRTNWKWGNKCDKFVNCHDARDGRWDNRGPRRRLSLRNRFVSPNESVRFYRGQRSRRVYANRFYVRNRRRY